MLTEIDKTILDNLIVGRVDPQIYAFETNTIPNYLKVGDTYRPLQVRMNEWRAKPGYEKLKLVYNHSARIDKDTIFRDYSVHTYLDNKFERLKASDLPAGIYFSSEFFHGANKEDVEEAIDDIVANANNPHSPYVYYTDEHLPKTISFSRTANYSPRPNQNDAIEAFKAAVANGRKNLLMYAVMRFGKSFTAMCCAKAMNEMDGQKCKFVVIVSGKGDVLLEWQKTVESHVYFSNFEFLDKAALDRCPHKITELLGRGKQVALFLTLQDLSGTGKDGDIKTRHADVFSNEIDLLVIDETHYGARGEVYGKILQDAKILKQQQQKELEGYDEDCGDLEESLKTLHANVKLHLSGTPYRILMGNEFESEDIISFCQFADIVEAQKKWDNDHLESKEWDNPYYGFPQMIRFAFNPTESARKLLKSIKDSGATYALSELFRPQSMTPQKDCSHKKFEHGHEQAILDIFKAIDGAKEDRNILPFLDYEKIKKGNMCRHIVCVLPYRASCDALEMLLNQNNSSFIHINEYKILNVAGFDAPYDDIKKLHSAISHCEEMGGKTITLTVNKLLTGSTVEYWDTMLYFKDTSSPQEYDQAIFRLQNQYVRDYVKDGETIKFNMKPQTLLVDFDPDRMFHLQELKSLFYNTNQDQRGNDELVKRIQKELEISPIVYLNKDKLEQVTPTNIIDAVRDYRKNKSILDEALDIPFDKSLLDIDEIKNVISALKPLGDKKGLELPPNEGDGTNLDMPPISDTGQGGSIDSATKPTKATDNEEDINRKLAAYYMRILFYAFLTHSQVHTLKQVIESIEKDKDNQRISSHVGLEMKLLKLVYEKADMFKLCQLDCTIQNVNTLGNDKSMPAIERAQIAMKKLSRISESEIVTPRNVVSDMVDMIPECDVNNETVVLDIASVQGEFAYGFLQKYSKFKNVKIFSVATSPLTYELTRKIYESLNLPVEWVLNFHSFALLGEKGKDCIDKIKLLKPTVIFAAPPYNQAQHGGRENSGNGSAIYQHFHNIVKNLMPLHFAMYLKSNWYSGGRGEGLDEFRKSMLQDERIAIFHDYPDPKTYIESNVTLRGGLCTFLWSREHTGKCCVYNHINNETFMDVRNMKYHDHDIFIRYNRGLHLLDIIQQHHEPSLSSGVYTRNAFKLQSNFDKSTLAKKRRGAGRFKVYMPKGKMAYISQKDIPDFEKVKNIIGSWKVIVAKASPGDDSLPHSIISTPILSEPGSLCTDSHILVRVVENKNQAENLMAYMKTRFFRFMMILAKNNQNMTRDTFQFVPLVDLNIRWTDAMLYDKYSIDKSLQEYIAKLVNAPRN